MPYHDSNATNDNDESAIVSDLLDGGGDQISITVGTSAVEGKVGGSPRIGRKMVAFQAKDTGIYMGFTAGVTTSNGIEIFKNQLLIIPVGANTSIYFIAGNAGNDLRFQELS